MRMFKPLITAPHSPSYCVFHGAKFQLYFSSLICFLSFEYQLLTVRQNYVLVKFLLGLFALLLNSWQPSTVSPQGSLEIAEGARSFADKDDGQARRFLLNIVGVL